MKPYFSKIYVPHYTRNPDRKLSMESQFGSDYELHFEERFDRDDLDIEQIRSNTIESRYAGSLLTRPSTGLSPSSAEISLSLKFEAILKSITKDDQEIACIMEDDMIIDKPMSSIGSYIDDLPDDWDVVFFGEGDHLRAQKSVMARALMRVLRRKVFLREHPSTRGADAILIKRPVAEKVLELYEGPVMAIDHYFNHLFRDLDLKVFWFDPPLLAHGSVSGAFDTSIQGKKE